MVTSYYGLEPEMPSHVVRLDDDEGRLLWEGSQKGHSIVVRDGKPILGPVPAEVAKINRRNDYTVETDPLFMKFLREKFADDPGMAEVMQKVEEIKARHPKEDGA